MVCIKSFAHFEKEHSGGHNPEVGPNGSMLELVIGKKAFYHMPQYDSRRVDDLSDIRLIPVIQACIR